ncbi:MAG TPA: CPBP family intramembrane glutamic endopeptidase [Kofleriaceae bacterium]|nr:CPBP family intramembrane glutamic endopeptidase [Kofleriaceae bacterium]
MPDSRRQELTLVFGSFVAVSMLVAVFVRALDVELPVVGHVGSAMVAITLLYAPVLVAWRRQVDLAEYGFTVQPLGRSLLYTAVVLAIIVPAFAVGYALFYQTVCEPDSALRALGLPGVCARFGGFEGAGWPGFDREFAEQILIQLVVVALPEELFFRGFLLTHLERALPPKLRILGGGVGWALVISAALFALIHLPKHGDPRALATFFPGLLFGWLRSATGSILSSTVTHASSNLLVNVVERVFLR